MNDIPIVEIHFSSEFDLDVIPELGAYSVSDMVCGIQYYYPDFQAKVLDLAKQGYIFKINLNDEYIVGEIDDLKVLLPYQYNKVRLDAIAVGDGNIAKIGLGVGLLVAGLSGVGLLGLSATTIGLMGASLVFTSLFKHPKSDTKTKTEKRSVNFAGVVNSTGGGQPLPLAFGVDVMIGSIVASAQIVPQTESV